MKKLLALLLTLIMAVSVVSIVPTVSAEETVSAKSKIYKSNNCCYTLDKKGYATVVAYYGIKKEEAIVDYWKIPSKLNGHIVKKFIWETYFQEYRLRFKKIKIPKTVTYIKGLKYYINCFNNPVPYDKYIDLAVVCDKGSRAESYAKQCQIEYIINGNMYGHLMYINFKIMKGKNVVKIPKSVKYTGKAHEFKITELRRGKQVLKKGRDFTVKYINNYNPGQATVVLVGKGKYYGCDPYNFDIVPYKPTVRIEQSKYFFFVNTEFVEYYNFIDKKIVQYSEKPDFKNYITVKNQEKDFKKLKKGKTYYFRCRYKVGGFNYSIPWLDKSLKYSDIVYSAGYYPQYSPWSDVKAVKIKYDYSNKQ